MAREDVLRDRMYLQQSAQTTDAMGGMTEVWTQVLTVPACFRQMSTRQLETYHREGFEHGIIVQAVDAISRTGGHSSLYSLLIAMSENAFRVIHHLNGATRTLTIIGVRSQSQGVHNTLGGWVEIDCVETPEGIGRFDA